MSKIRLDIPAYDTAMVRFVSQVLDGFVSLDPLFRMVSRRQSIHRGPVRNIRGNKPLDQTMQRVEITSELKVETIRNTDIEDHTRFLTELAEANHERLARGFFGGMEELTEATGNVVNAEGQPFSYDLLNDMLEKIQIGFDENGKPMFPTLITNPKQYERFKDVRPTPEQEQRLAKILEKKKAEHDAKKRTRRLSH